MHTIHFHDLEVRDYDVRVLARELQRGAQFVAFTENSTRLAMLIQDRDELGCSVIDGVPYGAGYYLVAVVEHGCYWFCPRNGLHQSYVAEKLGITPKDGEAVVWLLDQIAMNTRLTAA